MISAQTAQQKIWSPLWHLPRRGELIFSLAKRDLLTRYKRIRAWHCLAIVTPVVTIAIFTFIFAGIFGARFGGSNSHWDYALYLFCVWFRGTCFRRRFSNPPLPITGHGNLVKRVCLPTRNVAVAQALSRVRQPSCFATVAVVICDRSLIQHQLPLTGFVVTCRSNSATVANCRSRLVAGVAWSISARHCPGVSLVLMAWMYLTPIIYPESVVFPRNFVG
jgi:lipopolysaccharide transport system permease protein